MRNGDIDDFPMYIKLKAWMTEKEWKENKMKGDFFKAHFKHNCFNNDAEPVALGYIEVPNFDSPHFTNADGRPIGF